MAMPGVKNFEWDDEALMRDLNMGMDRAISKLAFIAQRSIKLLISKRNPPPKFLSPSKPGEAPRYRSRELLQSIMAEKLGPQHWQVGSPLDYALYLEFGTVAREAQRGFGDVIEARQYRMEPRPFLRPVLKWIRQKASNVVISEVTRAVA